MKKLPRKSNEKEKISEYRKWSEEYFRIFHVVTDRKGIRIRILQIMLNYTSIDLTPLRDEIIKCSDKSLSLTTESLTRHLRKLEDEKLIYHDILEKKYMLVSTLKIESFLRFFHDGLDELRLEQKIFERQEECNNLHDKAICADGEGREDYIKQELKSKLEEIYRTDFCLLNGIFQQRCHNRLEYHKIKKLFFHSS